GVQNPSGTPVFDGIQSSWVLNTVDLAPVLGQADLRLRFRMASDSAISGAGFAFDDLVLDVMRLDTVSPVPRPVPGLAAISAAPNPFNPTTGIAFTVPQDGPVRVTICDLKGRRVRTLVDETLPAGQHTRRWDGRTDDGARAASGVYLARLVSGDRRAVTKLTLLK
ncbi:T9SS type A sorting domain-containing protein, partial [bacterium]|nr:T9SS type A sorting domain-containing protein [bacterium]